MSQLGKVWIIGFRRSAAVAGLQLHPDRSPATRAGVVLKGRADTQVALGFYRKGRYRQESVALGARTTQRIARFGGPTGSEDWSDDDDDGKSSAIFGDI